MSDTTDDMEAYSDLVADYEDSTTWTTKEGFTIDIQDMDDKHLLNTYRFIQRRIEAEHPSHGDAEDNDYGYEQHPWYGKMLNMEAEIERRGL